MLKTPARKISIHAIISFAFLLTCVNSVPFFAQENRPVLIQEWVNLLHNGEPEDRIRAAQKLGELRAISAIDDLGQHLSDPEAKVRYHVIRALLEIRDPRIEPYLGQALLDPVPTNRDEALRSVYAYYLGTTVTTGIHRIKNLMLFRHFRAENPPWKKVDQKVVQSFKQWLNGDDETLQIRAIQAVEYLRIYSLLPEIVNLLKQPASESIVLAAFRTLGNLKACPQLESLTNWLYHENDRILEHAVWSLSHCGKESEPIRNQLYQAYLNEQRPSRQHIYYRGLALAGVPEAKRLFLEGLMSDDKDVRRWSAEGLGRLKAVDHIYEIAVAFLQEDDESTRLAMAFALFMMGRTEHIINFLQAIEKGSDLKNQAVSYILEYPHLLVPEAFRFFDRIDPSLKIQLLEIAGKTDDPTILPYLESLMNDKDETIAVKAFEALKQVRQAVALRQNPI